MKIINTKIYSGQRFIPEDKDYERVEQYKSAEDMMNEILKIKDLDKLCRRCIACIMGTGFGRNIHVWVERAKQLGADDTVINDLKDAIIDAFTETTDCDITIQASQLAAKVANKNNKVMENIQKLTQQPKSEFYPEGIPYYKLDRWLDQYRNLYEDTGKVYINLLNENNVLRPVTYCGIRPSSSYQFIAAYAEGASFKTIGDIKNALHKVYEEETVCIGIVGSNNNEYLIRDASHMYFLDGNLILSNAPELGSLESANIKTSKPEVKPETESKVITEVIKSGSVRIEPSTFSTIDIEPETLRKYIDAVIQVSSIHHGARPGSNFRQPIPKEYSDLVSNHKLSNVLFLCPDDPYLMQYQSNLDRAEIYILVDYHGGFSGSSAFGRVLSDKIYELFQELYGEEAPSDETINEFCRDYCLVKYEDYANSISNAILKQLGGSAQQVYEGCDDIDRYVIGFDIEGHTALVGTSLGWVPLSLNYTEAELKFAPVQHSPELERDVTGLFFNEPEDANITFRDDLFYHRYKNTFMSIDLRLD